MAVGQAQPLLRRWDQLNGNSICVDLGEGHRTELQLTLGEVGKGIQRELQQLGW